MSLQPGEKLGPYEIVALLGAGGMGEVYRAKDSRLDRLVAIKILPAHLSSNSTLKQRFEREARAVSSLNHPNICTLHDIGQQNGIDYLVMEFIEGETLQSRLRKGPLSISELLQYSIQIADALDKAHRHGIVHRDLKPGNIMLTKSGSKLLDFGLARKEAPLVRQAGDSVLPTASQPLTGEGTILGTLTYMAPEQLEGKEADARTDIFALGTVIYEMATGKRAFEGNSQASLISAIMSSDPEPISHIQPLTPAALDQVVRTCIEKNPEDRFQNAHDLMIQLRWISASASQPSITAPAIRQKSRVPRTVAFLLTLIAGLAAGYFLHDQTEVKDTLPTVRSILPLPRGTRLYGWASPVVAISPDGKKVAYVADQEGSVHQLYIHHLDKLEAQVVPGSEEAEGPFFSPDSEWIGFAVGTSGVSGMKPELKKYSVSSGLTQSICSVPDYFGGTWSNDGNIIFVGDSAQGLWKVSSNGGKPEHLGNKWKIDGKEERRAIAWPQFLPGDKKILATDPDTPEGYDLAMIDLRSRELRNLGFPSATFGRYTNSGHLIFSRSDASLMAVPFDFEKARPTGPTVALLRDICLANIGAAVVDVSKTGSFIYLNGYLRNSGRELMNLVKIDQYGKIQNLPVNADLFGRRPAISPDGRKLAVATWDGSVWVYDLQRNTRIKIIDGQVLDCDFPLWTPDGNRIVVSGYRPGSTQVNLYWLSVDGRGAPELLVEDEDEKHGYSWTPDGKTLVYESGGIEDEICLFTQGTKTRPVVLMKAKWNLSQGTISSDGKLIAYASSETGKLEIYVERYPELGNKIQISREGGRFPMWSSDGKKIYYRNGSKFMSVQIVKEPNFDAGNPILMFEIKDIRGYAIAPTTNEFYAVLRNPNSGIHTSLHLVTNWFPELKRLAPTNKN